MNDTFPRVPEFMLEFAQARAEGAWQMFAALFITTLEDAKAVCAGGKLDGATPERVLEWAASIRQDIDEDGFRRDFLSVLASEGFLMNTHPGFGLSLMNTPYVGHQHLDGLLAFEAACVEYGKGERDEPKVSDFLPDCPTAVKQECKRLLNLAAINRLTR